MSLKTGFSHKTTRCLSFALAILLNERAEQPNGYEYQIYRTWNSMRCDDTYCDIRVEESDGTALSVEQGGRK